MFGQIRLERSDRGCEVCWLETFFQTHPVVYNAERNATVSDYRITTSAKILALSSTYLAKPSRNLRL